MTKIDEISALARRLKKVCQTINPYSVCQQLGIEVQETKMGKGDDACKGFFVCISRIPLIMLNSDLSEEDRRIVLHHEIGHAQLHRKLASVQPFTDYQLFDSTSRAEFEANIFFAEFTMDDEEVLELLNEDTSFFNAARTLGVPPELLDFKFRVLKRKGYAVQPLMIANNDFMKNITRHSRFGR